MSRINNPGLFIPSPSRSWLTIN